MGRHQRTECLGGRLSIATLRERQAETVARFA